MNSEEEIQEKQGESFFDLLYPEEWRSVIVQPLSLNHYALEEKCQTMPFKHPDSFSPESRFTPVSRILVSKEDGDSSGCNPVYTVTMQQGFLCWGPLSGIDDCHLYRNLRGISRGMHRFLLRAFQQSLRVVVMFHGQTELKIVALTKSAALFLKGGIITRRIRGTNIKRYVVSIEFVIVPLRLVPDYRRFTMWSIAGEENYDVDVSRVFVKRANDYAYADDKVFALITGTHARLGKNSYIFCLPIEVLRYVLAPMCKEQWMDSDDARSFVRSFARKAVLST